MSIFFTLEELDWLGATSQQVIQQSTTNRHVQDIWVPGTLQHWIWTESPAYQGVSLHAHLQTAVT